MTEPTSWRYGVNTLGRIRGFTCKLCHRWVTARDMAGMSLERQKSEICFDCEPGVWKVI